MFDLAVIGGGINGCGIVRDAAGRGRSVLLRVVNGSHNVTRRLYEHDRWRCSKLGLHLDAQQRDALAGAMRVHA